MIRGVRYPWALGLAVLVVTLGSSTFAIGLVNRQKARPTALPSAGPSQAASVDPLSIAQTDPSPSPSPTSMRVSANTVNATYNHLASYLSSRGRHAAAGIVDLKTGARVVYNSNLQFETASIVKVDILATLMWQLQKKKAQLTSSQRTLATAMITQSDNNAASSLWSQIGMGTGLAAANRAFGLMHTTPGAGGTWGLTRTTVADQLRLLTVLSTTGPLTASSRSYVLGLMNKVISSQRWGVPHAAPAGASAVYVKDGWLPRSTNGYLWIINTVGRIVTPTHNWVVVVLSNYNSTMNTGISLVQKASDLAVDGLGG